jgi:Mrp family chromosome partitioning ATPase
MAKTYEAIQKSQAISTENSGTGSYLRHWNYLNLRGKKNLADILTKVCIEQDSNGSSAFHFSSALNGEGTSTILINLAHFLIGDSSRNNILFIDGNFENPVFHLAFDLPPCPGLSEILKKEAKLSQAVHRLARSSVYIMTCGDTLFGDHLSLESTAILGLVKALRQKFEIIIFDSPPLLSSSISIEWANAADVSFMIIEANRNQWEVARKAQVLLENNNCKIGGVVLNRVQYSIPSWLYKRL